MNRENKRKTFEKGYYKTHACKDTFTCKVCGRLCTPQNAGSDHRNHCPNCLSSLHVDIEPGNRASDCGGIMEPVAVWVRRGGEWAIIHRCKRCGALSSNRVAADDNPMKLMSIAMKPLCEPPFPLDRIEEMTGWRPDTFTYPFGSYSRHSQELLEQLGFAASLGVEGKPCCLTRDPACLIRIPRYTRTSQKTAEELLCHFWD